MDRYKIAQVVCREIRSQGKCYIKLGKDITCSTCMYTAGLRLSTLAQVDGELSTKLKPNSKEVTYLPCIKCGTEMECYDDINDCSTRVDFVRCPNCSSDATIYREVSSSKVAKITWRQGR